MAVNSYWYAEGLKNILNGNIDVDTSTFKVCLLTNAYNLTNTLLRTHDAYADVTTTQITGTNYTAGGVAITLGAPSVDTTNGGVLIGAAVANTEWTSATFTARYAVIYEASGTNADMYLMGIVDFGADETCSSGTFTIDWNATAIFKLTPAEIT